MEWAQRILLPDFRGTGAAGIVPTEGQVVVQATRREAPEENMIDLELVEALLTADGVELACLGQTGANTIEYESLSGWFDLATGNLSVDVTGRLTNDLFLPGEPLTFVALQRGTLDLANAEARVMSFSKVTLPPSFDANQDGVLDWCLEPIRVVYVASDASGANDGSSWTDAFRSLQDALDDAGNNGVGEQIWVKAGVYKPSSTADPNDPRSATFRLKPGVAIYGGFAGDEDALDERSPFVNQTILSGDLAGDDEPGFQNRDDNAYHVVTAIDTADRAILDGFAIVGGHADGSSFETSRGGGVWISDALPRIEGCRFRGNFAIRGGAVFSTSAATIVRSSFFRNASVVSGGAIQLPGTDDLEIISCSFWGNQTQGRGGAISMVGSGPRIWNTVFSGNHAAEHGGAVNCVGGSSPAFRNCTWCANDATAGQGGGLRVESSSVQVLNAILWGNQDSQGTGEPAQISLDAESTIGLANSCVQGLTGLLGGVDNLGVDPRFADAAGEDGVPGTPDDDLHLQSNSLCLNAGCDEFVPIDHADLDRDGDWLEALPVDHDDQQRFFDVVDVGAYESQVAPCIGDLDDDGQIGLADLAQLLTHYGETSGMTYEEGDIDGDGDVDLGDLAALLGVYGAVCP